MKHTSNSLLQEYIVQQNEIDIRAGEYVPIPGNPTKWVVPGPAKVRVVRYDNGIINVFVIDGTTKPVELALAKKMTRLGWGV